MSGQSQKLEKAKLAATHNLGSRAHSDSLGLHKSIKALPDSHLSERPLPWLVFPLTLNQLVHGLCWAVSSTISIFLAAWRLIPIGAAAPTQRCPADLSESRRRLRFPRRSLAYRQ